MKNSGVMLAVRNLVFVGISLAFATMILEEISNLFDIDCFLAIVTTFLLICTFIWLVLWTIFIQEEAELLGEYYIIENLGLKKVAALSAPLILGILFGFLITSLFDLKIYLIFAIIIAFISLVGDLGAIKYFSNERQLSKEGKNMMEKKLNWRVSRRLSIK